MVRQLKHEELAELLGAYALDAVEPDEAQVVESHLLTCPRCRAEVQDHREVASLLAYSGAPAPAGLWERLAASLEDAGPPIDAPVLAPVTSLTAVPRPVRSFGRRPGGSVLAAAAAVLVVLGAFSGLWVRQTLESQGDRIDEGITRVSAEAALSQAALAAGSSPGARTVHLRAGADGPVLADAVITPDGSSYLYNVKLPALGQDRAYQLWAVVGQDKRSVGVLGSAPGVRAFNVPLVSLNALAITEEVASGVDSPKSQAVVFGLVPPADASP